MLRPSSQPVLFVGETVGKVEILVPAERISRLFYCRPAAWVAALSRSLVGRAEITEKTKTQNCARQLSTSERT